MSLAWKELRRRPGRFAVAGVILTLIAILLMFLGGLIDGLIGASTGASSGHSIRLTIRQTASNRAGVMAPADMPPTRGAAASSRAARPHSMIISLIRRGSSTIRKLR